MNKLAAQIARLDQGGRIDRSQAIGFSFNGKAYGGFAGDTLASALLANGVHLVGRSFKYHRPRGIVGSGAEEPNAIMQIGKDASTQPNLRATQVELYDGLIARSTKGWPGLRFDVSAVFNLFGRVFGAGFYYKTFIYPRRLWSFWEHLIRHSAGLGTAPTKPDPDSYSHRNAHCDVLIAGAGPSGIAAALVAARAGARVILADEQSEPGGSLLASKADLDGKPAAEWLATAIDELAANTNVTLLPRTTIFGYYDNNFLAGVERCTEHLGEHCHDKDRQRLWRIRARQVVIAQGAIERPLVFCNNDRPGVMLASAVSIYLNRFAVRPGKSAVVFTNNDSAYQCAMDLHHSGGTVAAIVDSRTGGAGTVAQAAAAAGIPILNGHVISNVRGRGRVRGVDIAKWNGDAAQLVTQSISIDCDVVAMSGGWNPTVHLHSQSGGKNVWNDTHLCFNPGEPVQQNISVGSCNGTWSLQDCLLEGSVAGCEAAARSGYSTDETIAPQVSEVESKPMEALWRVPATKDPDRCPKQLLDYQTDACVSDIRLAAREGYANIEHVKRYTALGFGTDQGKLGNINGMAILADLLEKPIQQVGTTTFRPAYTPVTFGVAAGDDIGMLFEPLRKTALHDWHSNADAPMEVVGQWHRPWYFPRNGEDLHAAVVRECLATRNSLGIMDASTLGKIDVQGPDAVAFLERIYTHNIARMESGRCAYGILLGEDGMLMDDGVMTRLGEQHFYLTTTTGGAAAVLGWLEKWLQTEWPELRVRLTSLTDQFSTIAVAGPNSRSLLQKLGCDISLERDNFPFMSVRDAVLAGTPVQLFRVSFSGELAFEINLPSNSALSMWQRLMHAGAEFEITPYGTETMHVLRAEKGFVIVGQDTDGSVTPVDLKMNWLLSKDKDFLGKRSLQRPDCLRTNRKQLVGLRSCDGVTVVPEGTQLVDDPSLPVPVPMCGHVTSSYYSACLQQPIALALVMSGHERMGDTITAAMTDGRMAALEIVSPVFYDAEGERQNA